uniref:Zinc finger piccolo-type domain-containing protein n=1 Tax=Sphenodon punctatus TaxID=8508 RepID=A0A8D0GHG3_SPHPU
MGNEASLEGGEGLAGLPEEGAGAAAAAAAGDGGGQGPPLHPLISAGMEADLSQLSSEERRQIAAVMSRAQGLPKGNLPGTTSAEPPPMQRHPEFDTSHYSRQPGKPPDPGPPSLSKSRTVDTLKTEQRSPGRSPSTTSLRESRSRTDFKEDQKPSMMSSFLSDANPFGAVSSVVNKFNPFDLISDSDAGQEESNKKQKAVQKEQAKPEQQKGPTKQTTPQQSPKPTAQQQGSPDAAKASFQAPAPTKPSVQQTGPGKQPSQQPGQQAGSPKPSSQQAGPTKPPSQQAGPAKQPSSQQVGSMKQPLQHPGPAKPSPQQAGPVKQPSQHPGPTKPSGQQPGPEKQQAAVSRPADSVPKKTFCPLCTTTELLLHTPEKANYNTCTQCQTVVCSLCGFNPNPHITEVSCF